MPREIGPREKALRAQREADFEENQKRVRDADRAAKLPGLQQAIDIASAKRGKPRKAKK